MSPARIPTGRRRQRSSSSTTEAAVGGPSSTSRLSRLRSSGGSTIAAVPFARAGRQIDDRARQGAAVAALCQHHGLAGQRFRHLAIRATSRSASLRGGSSSRTGAA